MWWTGRLADHLDTFAIIKVLDWGGSVDWVNVPLQKHVLGWQSEPVWLENQLGHCQSLCNVGALMVSPLDILNSSGDSTTPSAIFSSFFFIVIFSSSAALMIQSIRLIHRFCPYKHYWTAVLFLPTFCSPGKYDNENACLHHNSDCKG